MRCDKPIDDVSWTSHIPVFFTNNVLDRRTVAEVQRKVIKQGGRNAVSRFFHARDDKEMIAAWKYELNRILHVFNVCPVHSYLAVANCPPLQTELAMTTHTIVADVHQNVLKIREATDGQIWAVSDPRALHHHRINTDHCTDPEQVSDLDC